MKTHTHTHTYQCTRKKQNNTRQTHAQTHAFTPTYTHAQLQTQTCTQTYIRFFFKLPPSFVKKATPIKKCFLWEPWNYWRKIVSDKKEPLLRTPVSANISKRRVIMHWLKRQYPCYMEPATDETRLRPILLEEEKMEKQV